MAADLRRRNAEACCVCKTRHVGLHLHHIDGDHSNTIPENLAVLCVRDHDAHHRPSEYAQPAAVNHLDLSVAQIAAAKIDWEAFVAEAAKSAPAVLATVAAYGTLDVLHSMRLAFQWADGRLVFERVYHLLDATPTTWVDRAYAEIAWLGPHIQAVLVNRVQAVERCPCCERGTTTVIHAGFARRLTSTSWSASSVCAIYVNPEQASLAITIDDDRGEAFRAALHRCGSVIDVVATAYHERVVVSKRPSVRRQVSRIIAKILEDWKPGRTFIGTGPHDCPRMLGRLQLPAHWEDGP